MTVLPDETLDELRLGGLKIIQKKEGYRFSLDPVLLCAFAEIREGERVADLGTGAGIIPLLLARKTAAAQILGIENQPSLSQRAQRNVILNDLGDRVKILEADVRHLPGVLAAQSFEVVLSNPPFRRDGTGRTASLAEKAAARHELAGGICDFLQAAAFLLKDTGRIYLVYLAERLAELLAAMRQEKLEPKRLRCVHSRRGEDARMVLVEGRKRGRSGLRVEPPLIVYEGEDYSFEVLSIYGEAEGS
jgi:tRNA1Val (adenine37-N6)-methyltransferase